MKRITLNLLLFANSILLIMYMALAINRNMVFNTTGIVSLNLSSLILIDITYISSCNVRGNKVISLFCGLLALHSICSFIGLLASNEIFSLFYGIQFLAGWLCFIFIVVFHRKRTAFVWDKSSCPAVLYEHTRHYTKRTRFTSFPANAPIITEYNGLTAKNRRKHTAIPASPFTNVTASHGNANMTTTEAASHKIMFFFI